MMYSHLHTHTTFSDGKNTPEEMVLSAIEKGLKTIGISDHSVTAFDSSYCLKAEQISDYIKEIERLKEKYRDKIEVLCGIEQDLYSPKVNYKFDYIIGSVHYIKVQDEYVPVDLSAQALKDAAEKYFGGDHYAYAASYYLAVAETANKYDPTFFGHIDLVAKYNEGGKYFDESHPRYRKAALEALEALLPAGKPFEINTGAISRGARITPYPAPFILKEIRAHGGHILFSGDSHSAAGLLCAYEQATELARSCGFDTAMILSNEGLQEMPF